MSNATLVQRLAGLFVRALVRPRLLSSSGHDDSQLEQFVSEADLGKSRPIVGSDSLSFSEEQQTSGGNSKLKA